MILTLKARALHEINKCLRSNDISTALGDTTIGAVAKLAAFEAVFGDVCAYRQHMCGLRRMLDVRGELGKAMGPLDAFLRRLVCWIEVNAEHFVKGDGGGRVLELGVEIGRPDPLLFAGTERGRGEILFEEGICV